MFEELEQDKIQNFEAAPAQEPATEVSKVEAPKEEPKREENLNVRGLRLAKEKAEKEAAELKKYIESLSQQRQPEVTKQADPVDDDWSHLEDDSFADVKIVKQLKKEIKETRQQLQQINQINQQSNAEMRLKSDYPDIMEVVTNDNINDLKAIRPDLFETVMYNPDMYKRGKIMREMIKEHVLSERYEAQDKKLEENKMKPRAAASVPTQQGETPLTRVGDYDRRILSPERIRQLQEQVKESKKYR